MNLVPSLSKINNLHTIRRTEAWHCTKCCCNPLTVLWLQISWSTCEGTIDTSTALKEELDIYCVSSDHRSVSSETHFSKCCTEKSRQIEGKNMYHSNPSAVQIAESVTRCTVHHKLKGNNILGSQFLICSLNGEIITTLLNWPLQLIMAIEFASSIGSKLAKQRNPARSITTTSLTNT